MTAGGPPNILYIHSHDTGRYVQPYGHPVPTPNIQMLAEQGAFFRQAFCASPDLLGLARLPADRAVLPFQRDVRARPPGLVAQRLRRAPGPPAAIGRVPLGTDRRAAHLRRPGRDRLRRDSSRSTPTTPPTSPRSPTPTLREVAEPFFLSVGFFETHREFHAPTSVRDTLYSLPAPDLPDTLATREDMAAFKASARSLDQGIGSVLNELYRPRPRRAHAGGLHDRPRPRLPAREGDAVRPRHRGDAADARPRRVHRRQGRRLHGQPPRRLPDALRGRGRRRRPDFLQGTSLLAARPRRGRPRCTTSSSPR